MNLSYIIGEIENILSGREKYRSFILKDISILEKNEEDVVLFPILEIDVEVDEKEITLISTELAENTDQKREPLSLKGLYNLLISQKEKHSTFELFSGSAMVAIDDEHYGRLDTPLVAFGVNDDDKEFVLVQTEKDE